MEISFASFGSSQTRFLPVLRTDAARRFCNLSDDMVAPRYVSLQQRCPSLCLRCTLAVVCAAAEVERRRLRCSKLSLAKSLMLVCQKDASEITDGRRGASLRTPPTRIGSAQTTTARNRGRHRQPTWCETKRWLQHRERLLRAVANGISRRQRRASAACKLGAGRVNTSGQPCAWRWQSCSSRAAPTRRPVELAGACSNDGVGSAWNN